MFILLAYLKLAISFPTQILLYFSPPFFFLKMEKEIDLPEEI